MPDPVTSAPQIQSVIDALPTAGVIAMGAALALGVVLWLLGGKLARPACAVCGLVMGGGAGFVVGQAMQNQGAYTLPLVIGGAIAGALIAALLFRVWVAAIGAGVLALVVPAAVLIWQGEVVIGPSPPPEQGQNQADAGDAATVDDDGALHLSPSDLTVDIDLGDRGDQGDQTASGDAPRHRVRDARTGSEAEEDADAEPGTYQKVLSAIKQVYQKQADAVAQQWDALDSSSKAVVYTGGLIGAGVGLVLGLLAPYLAAGLQTALVGSLLIVLAGRELVLGLLPDQAGWMPDTPRALLLTIGLITLIGAALQWTLFVRKTDKR